MPAVYSGSVAVPLFLRGSGTGRKNCRHGSKTFSTKRFSRNGVQRNAGECAEGFELENLSHIFNLVIFSNYFSDRNSIQLGPTVREAGNFLFL